MQNQNNIIIILSIVLTISLLFNLNYRKELKRIEEFDQRLVWGLYDSYAFSLRQFTQDTKKYLETKDQESLIKLVVQGNKAYNNYYQLIYENLSSSKLCELSEAMRLFNWRISDFTHLIRHMDIQDIEYSQELILTINQQLSDSFYDFYEYTKNRATTISVSSGGELIPGTPTRASVTDLFENQTELAKKVAQTTDCITPLIEKLKAIDVSKSEDAQTNEFIQEAVKGYHIEDLGYGIRLPEEYQEKKIFLLPSAGFLLVHIL